MVINNDKELNQAKELMKKLVIDKEYEYLVDELSAAIEEYKTIGNLNG